MLMRKGLKIGCHGELKGRLYVWMSWIMRMITMGLANQIAGKLRLKSVAVHGWRAIITWVYRELRDTIVFFFEKCQPNILPNKFEANFTSRRCDVSSLSYSRNSLAYSHCSRYVECIILKPSHNLLLVSAMSSGARDEQANLQWQAGQHLGPLSFNVQYTRVERTWYGR